MPATKSPSATFETILFKAGKNATGFEIPADVVATLGAGKKPPVYVTINGYTYRNTIAVYGGVFMIGVSAEHRGGAGIEAGDALTVTLVLDTDPRTVDVPAGLQQALDEHPTANRNFQSLSYSKQQGIVLPIKDAKSEETRQKRIDKSIELLLLGKG